MIDFKTNQLINWNGVEERKVKAINKVILCTLSLFFSNFVIAQDLLIEARNVPENTLLNIFLSNPFGFILFLVFAFFFGRHFSK